ncbi:PAS domain-containing sensor histidine kinase [Methanocella sp. MCL-LM]|uniref:PAS domain-containing sensor histidine kinase n=1 Tax=Methanocella sp. MCL-LM TaxID=3412035 RepID=UPI003C72A28A
MNGQLLKPGSAVPAEGCIDHVAAAIVHAALPFAVLDQQGKITLCNKAFCDMTGYRYDEIAQVDLLTGLVPEGWREPILKMLKARNAGNSGGKIEFEMIRKCGHNLSVCSVMNYVDSTASLPPYYIMFFSDLTEQKLAEATSSKRESRMARALRIARIGTWEVDVATGLFTCSDEVLRIAGAGLGPSAILIGKLFQRFVYADDSDRVCQEFKELIDGSGTIDTTLRIVRLDNSVRIVKVEGERIPGSDGKPARLFGTIQDITERKHAEDELKAAKAQAELYVDLMGHDINNMNQIAMGYLELAEGIIEAHGSLGVEDRFLITRPIETLRDNSRLIDNVRKIQKSKAGVYKTEDIQIGNLLQEVISRFSGITGRDVRINLVSSCSCMVIANELLKEVFLNLIGNAIKHSTGSLSVNITAEKCEEDGCPKCRVAIEDDGPGIPDDLKKKLFDRLSLEKTRASGKGFGLCLTKILVDDFNGRFWVEDRVAGDYSQGCRFIVLLPTFDKCEK